MKTQTHNNLNIHCLDKKSCHLYLTKQKGMCMLLENCIAIIFQLAKKIFISNWCIELLLISLTTMSKDMMACHGHGKVGLFVPKALLR